MPPLKSRDFLKVAAQRLTTAEFLLKNKYTLAAMYIAGYTVECSLKALILDKTPEKDRTKWLKKPTSGAKMHSPEALAGFLKDEGIALPLDLVKRLRTSTWTTNLRYETGRTDTGETRAFLRTAKLTYQWVERQVP